MLEWGALLSTDVLARSVRVGTEWLIPLEEGREAILTATAHEIAVPGLESFRVFGNGFKVLDYSGHEFLMDGDWLTFVLQNNRAASAAASLRLVPALLAEAYST